MSKAFTSEETEEAPLVVRPRAPLPAGTINYVTPFGFAALGEELRQLREERMRLNSKGDERQRDLTMVSSRIIELEQRLATATVVEPKGQREDQVHFGATVAVQSGSDAVRSYQIVGVDEADVKQGKIAFVAPLARALFGRKVGEAVTVSTPRSDEELTVISIAYW